ncbi:NAD(P)H-dependent oxidoreductase [bacterium]|nr:NAD(P)H-dependent oxidoreductase [bacterium]
MKKTVFIYFSYSGDNDKLAELFKQQLGCDILKLEPMTEYTHNSIKILFQGGSESIRKKSPELKSYHFNSADYEAIIIGTPVWAWTFSPPLRTFMLENEIKNKQIYLTCTHRGSPGNTIQNLREFFSDNEIILTKEIHAPIGEKENIELFFEEVKIKLNKKDNE